MTGGMPHPAMIKRCIICGAAFESPPSTNKVTCSPACRSIRAAQVARRSSRTWSQDAKSRRAADPDIKQRMETLQPVGTAAALALPEGQRGEQNRASKVWELISPDGSRVVVTNLKQWARDHYKQFEPDCTDAEASAQRIACGFRAIASSMRGVKSRERPVSSYKGWGLASCPEAKQDLHKTRPQQPGRREHD